MHIPVVRAQHVIDNIGVLRDAGVPIERELERSRLPAFIEQTPDAYVSLPRALDWAWRSSRELGIMEVGFLAGRATSLSRLHPAVQRAVIGAPTGLSRIEALSHQVHRENSALQIDIRREGVDRRVLCEVRGFQNSPFVGFAEWKAIVGVINIVRSAAGSDWCPTEITFVSRGRPSHAAREAYGNARILTGQQHCSILVAAADIAQICIGRRSSAVDVNGPTSPPRTPFGLGDAWDFVTAVRALIRPYLAQGHPPLSLVAEIVGMSERSLQRRLAKCGATYSDIVQDARFAIASDLLVDSDLNIADIAFAAGYENAPHFSRAFKRLTGMTPRDYRGALV
ncbi:AraC family transcriptional regulator [Thiorhodovibrio frisius]|uniref:DNA-binding domain-containing protein, AraC-type n=1 Tax=Thiorhodovibrio frisius TaxID=631362 RepID=H8Z8G6_9GAMM|nr:AraC family transcriptional regulator [Thiorhodovibrio frisius]EIC19371.1 DNA-binding domain-containing protein, AraC-type [Thiorhodovibrio frisius]WPL22330.1 Virulence-regulating protein VirS [Thiorhodovibrio frisius]